MGLLEHVNRRAAAVKPAAAPTVLLADISEWEPEISDQAYLAWSEAVIVRAMYGTSHVDKAWYDGARRAALHAGGARFVGIYQYIVASQSVVAQAHALLDLLGGLKPGERLYADIEEGAGNQGARWQAWAKIIRTGTGEQPGDYSGLDFAAAHGLAPEWVAAYGQDEPQVPHVLWQFSENYEVPGIGPADCSLFRGSIDELAALAYQPPAGRPAARPAAPVVTAGNWRQVAALLPVLKAGDKDTAEPWMVRRVQGLVGALGPGCAVTGVFDTATREAVAVFQQNHALPATGTVDAETWLALITGRA